MFHLPSRAMHWGIVLGVEKNRNVKSYSDSRDISRKMAIPWYYDKRALIEDHHRLVGLSAWNMGAWNLSGINFSPRFWRYKMLLFYVTFHSNLPFTPHSTHNISSLLLTEWMFISVASSNSTHTLLISFVFTQPLRAIKK